MERAGFDRAGTIIGGFGALVCVACGAWRVAGNYEVGGFDIITLFDVGAALMVAGCLAKLHALGGRVS